MSRLGPTGLTQLLTIIKTWVTTKLGNYVTTDTTQTVTGKKLFTASSIQLDNVTSMSGSTMFIDTSAAAPRGEFPTESHRVGRVYIGDNTSYNGSWFIVDPTIDTNKAYYRMVTTNPDNTDSTRFSITWDGSKTGARCRKNVSQGDLLPSGNNIYNLGADELKWDIGYIHNLIGTNKENLTEDANDYYSTTSGSHMTFYTMSNGGTKLSNVPAAVNTHLESRTIRYLSSSDWIVEQICHNSFGLYYRKGTNDTWEDWKTFAFTNSNITGTAANVTGTVAIANGGTGATTRLNAVKNLTNESVGTPTHFLTITTNYAKAGYTNISQAKTVLGITGDMGSHSDSEYVHKTGDESINGVKTFSNNIAINGTYLGTEASTNERTNIYLLANRDTANASGAYIGRFRQNRTQGAMESADVSFISFDFLENSTRYTRCFTMGMTDWDNDKVPQTYYLTSPDGKGSLGTATNVWNKVYANSYYLGTTSFTDKFVTTDTAQTITGVKTFNSDKLVSNQGNAYRIANSAGTGYGVFQRTDGTYWYMLVTANNDPLGTWTSARPITIRLSDGYCTINGKANEANKVQATIAADATTALVQASVASNDLFRIAAGGAANAGWAEIATGDDANEPIYVRQYKGAFATLQRTATLLDGSGNTSFPGTVTATGFSGPVSGNASSATEFSANKSVTLTGDVTGTASSKAGWSVATTLSNSGVTAGTYGPSADVTGSNNATILVPEITVDAKGRVTAVNNRTYTSVNTDSDKKVYQYYKSDDNVYRLLFSNNAGNTATSNVGAVYSGLNNSFYVNPSTGALYATKLYSNGVEVLTAHPSITLSTNTTSTESPSHGGTFTCIDSVTQDSNGHITKVNTKTITLPADSNTDTKVTQTVTTANSGYPVLLCATANATATETTTSRFSAGLTVNARYSAIYMTNKYDTANTKGVRNTSSYSNGYIVFRCYDASEMGRIHCESSKNGYQQTYMQARSYIKDGAISPEGTATTCYITVRVRDNGSKTIYTDGSWENSLTPYANNTHSLGTSSLQWKNAYAVNIYENGTALSSKYAQVDNISENGIGTTRLLAYFPANTTDLSLLMSETRSGTSLYVVYWRLESTASVSDNVYTDYNSSLVVNKNQHVTGTWKLLHSMSQGATSKAMIGVWVRTA